VVPYKQQIHLIFMNTPKCHTSDGGPKRGPGPPGALFTHGTVVPPARDWLDRGVVCLGKEDIYL
jgi:hypothetical protein